MATRLEAIRDTYDRRFAPIIGTADTDVPDEGEASDRNGDVIDLPLSYCDGCGALAQTIHTSDLGELCANCRRDVVLPEPARKPQQIAVSSTTGNVVIVTLCEDGTIWTLNTAAEVPTWQKLPSIPR